MTTNKGLQTPANGTDVGNWDVPVNANFTAIDTAFGGKATISTTGGTTVLTSAQYQPLFLVITGVLTSNAIIQFPSGVGGQWVVLNSTTGSFTVTFSSASGGATYTLAQNIRTVIVCDGATYGVTLSSNLAATAAPGGSTTQVQYNNAGSLAASANFTFDGTNVAVSGAVASGSLTPTAALAANYGGTGQTVLTANNVLLGNGTTAVQFVAPGTTGNVLASNGTTWVSTAPSAAGNVSVSGTTPVNGQLSQWSSGTTIQAITTGTGVVTALGVNVETAGAVVVNGGALGTPSGGTLTNATGLPISTGVTGLGTGIAAALNVNAGSAGAPVINGGALGTPSGGTLTNATGLPISTGVTGLGTGIATALAVTPGSAGALIINGGDLGTPSAGTLTNATGLPISTGVTGLGTGIATALGVNAGSAGAPVINGGALGTPSAGTLTNATGLPISTGVTGLGTGIATALGVNAGSAGAPVINGGALGTPSGGTLTNATGLPISTGVTGLGTGIATALAATPQGSGSVVLATSPTLTTPVISSIVNTGTLTLPTTTGTVALYGNAGVSSMSVFTASNASWAIPAGVSRLKVTVVGAGGNGATGVDLSSGAYSGGGGGGGGTAIQVYTGLTPGATLNVTVGTTANATSSVTSGTQTIVTVQATGGASANTSTNNPPVGGNGGVGSGGLLNIKGNPGNPGSGTLAISNGTLLAVGGSGGGSTFGGGGVCQSTLVGSAGGNYGSGGAGGGAIVGGGGSAGGAFAPGVVIIEY